MKYNGILLFLVLAVSCGNPDKQRDRIGWDQPGRTVYQESQRRLAPEEIVIPEGYQIEPVASGLSYPVDVTFDEEGNTYIAEAGGHTYGTKPGRAPRERIIQLMSDGTMKVLYDKVVKLTNIKKHDSSEQMEEGLIPPVTGVTYFDGKLYIAHRSRYSTYDLETGKFKTIINGLPSWGEFLNGKAIFRDGKMYFHLATQGNSGVIEEHWSEVINEYNKKNTHEIPGEDVTLTGKNFWVPTHKMKIVDEDSLLTGVFVPLGEQTEEGQVIKGEKICNGSFFRCDPDGRNMERLAWGLRSCFGYRFSPGGRLITTMNSANPMPPRGFYFDYETVYEIVEGEWYGWPDFFSGIPVTDTAFGLKPEEQGFVLTEETHRKLLAGKELPRQPLVKLPVHSAAEGMVFGNGRMGLAENDILVAEFGSIVPEFKGEEFHPHLPEQMPSEPQAPHDAKYNWPGFRIQKVNLDDGNISDFIYNKSGLPASANGGGGLERPVQVEWSDDGSLYIVDFGIIEFDDVGMNAHPFTGVLWRVKKK